MGNTNWTVAADRLAVGEAVELKTFPGKWVKPRKFTKQGAAEILAAQTRQTMKTRAVSKKIADALRQNESDAAAAGLSAETKSEIAITIMQNANADMVGHLEEDRERIFHGIAEHNFGDTPEAPTREWVDAVMGYADIADEILEIVRGKNLPLA